MVVRAALDVDELLPGTNKAAEDRFIKSKVVKTSGKEKPHVFLSTAFNPNRRLHLRQGLRQRMQQELLTQKPCRPRLRDESHKWRSKRDICGDIGGLQGLGHFGVANFLRLWSSTLMGYPSSLLRLWTATGPGSCLGVNLLCGFPSAFLIAFQDFCCLPLFFLYMSVC